MIAQEFITKARSKERKYFSGLSRISIFQNSFQSYFLLSRFIESEMTSEMICVFRSEHNRGSGRLSPWTKWSLSDGQQSLLEIQHFTSFLLASMWRISGKINHKMSARRFATLRLEIDNCNAKKNYLIAYRRWSLK